MPANPGKPPNRNEGGRVVRAAALAAVVWILDPRCSLLASQQIPQQRPARASIQGIVTGEGGRGIAGAEVVLKAGTRDVSRTLTTADGVFRFIEVTPGEYQLAVSREGYSPLAQGGLRVGPSELVTVDLKLLPAGGRAP